MATERKGKTKKAAAKKAAKKKGLSVRDHAAGILATAKKSDKLKSVQKVVLSFHNSILKGIEAHGLPAAPIRAMVQEGGDPPAKVCFDGAGNIIDCP